MEWLNSLLYPILILTWLVSMVFLWKFIFTDRNNKLKCPPGPKPWPIIGNLNVMSDNPHRSFHELSKKYGELVQLKFGSSSVIVASSPEMAKEFLKAHDLKFASRPATSAGKHTGYNFSNVTWAPYGPYWRQARRIYANELLSNRQLDLYEYIRIEEMKNLISKLYRHVREPMILREHLLSYTMTNISRMALGEKYFSEGDSGVTDMEELRETIQEWFALNGAFNIGDYIPWLSFLDLQGYMKRMKLFYRKMDRFNTHVVSDHRAKMKLAGANFKPKDIIDVLVQLADDPILEIKLTDDNVKALMQDVLVGGTDSSAMVVEWAMSALLKQPHLLEKATEELDRVIGRERWVEEKDSAQLPFLDAVVKETMRLYPVGTLTAPHLSLEDCTVSGYHIPRGTTLLVNIWSLGRDPRYWDNPGEFRPERFIGKDIDESGHHFELLPFGTGRRMCPGYRLGMRVTRSTLANLIHGFSWKLPDNVKPEDIDMEEEYGLISHRKIPINTVIEPRLQAHMYQVE